MITIWHNPRCSKSRQTLKLLQDRGLAVTERRYLEDVPTAAELRDALRRLDLPAIALVRASEPEFATSGLTRESPDAALIAALAANPRLIQRPVVFHKDRAAIGRPPKAVLAIL